MYYVYILASWQRVLYIGVTGKLEERVHEHVTHKYRHSFTAQYKCTRLVHVEMFTRIVDAIAREKTLKGWRRSKKIALIQSTNPEWIDLSEQYTPMSSRA